MFWRDNDYRRMSIPVRHLPFLKPVFWIAGVLVLCHVVFYLQTILSQGDVNRAAARIRDMEALRTARALTKINEWRQYKEISSFRYEASGKQSTSEVSHDAPGITFAILAADRRTHEIDDYHPFYLTETLTLLIESIYHDLAMHGNRFQFVNITLCPTADNLATFSELKDVSHLLPQGCVKPRSRLLDSYSLGCRTLLDASSCLLQSTLPSSSPNNYVILLEDDMMPEVRVMNQLWRLVGSLSARSTGSVGAVQLHTPPKQFAYSLSDGRSLIELVFLSSLLTIILFVVWLRHWYRPFMLPYNLILVCSSLIVCFLFVTLIGRTSWMTFWNRTFGQQSVFLSPRPDAAATGAAVLFPSNVARQLAKEIEAYGCAVVGSGVHGNAALPAEKLKLVGKASVISDILSTRRYSIWRTFPNLFRHRGLYSIYQKSIINPSDVE